jgi:hypothetical protein
MKRLLLLMSTASYAHADIFIWTDIKGTTHHTNSEYEIPEWYRAKVKVLKLGIVAKKDNSSSQQGTPAQRNMPALRREQVQPVTAAQPPAILRPGGNSMGEHPAKRVQPEDRRKIRCRGNRTWHLTAGLRDYKTSEDLLSSLFMTTIFFPERMVQK